MTNEEKATISWTQGYREHQFSNCYPSQQGFYQKGFVDGAEWKEQQFIETAQEDAESYVKGVAKANPDLSADVLNLLETAFIAGRNRW